MFDIITQNFPTASRERVTFISLQSHWLVDVIMVSWFGMQVAGSGRNFQLDDVRCFTV